MKPITQLHVRAIAGVIFSIGALRHLNATGQRFEDCTFAEPFHRNTGATLHTNSQHSNGASLQYGRQLV